MIIIIAINTTAIAAIVKYIRIDFESPVNTDDGTALFSDLRYGTYYIKEKLKEKAFEEFLHELNAQEMKEIDEVVSFNYNNREDDV